MQANALHPGHEYAFVYRPRNKVRLIHGAKRCRVLHVYKNLDEEPDPFSYGRSKKRTTLVEIKLLDNETGEDLQDQPIKTVEARQIYATWEDHATELKIYNEKKAKQEAEWEEIERQRKERYERENEERRRRLEEQQRKERESRDNILELFAKADIPSDLVRIGQFNITIDRAQLERRVIEPNAQSGTSEEIISDSSNVTSS